MFNFEIDLSKQTILKFRAIPSTLASKLYFPAFLKKLGLYILFYVSGNQIKHEIFVIYCTSDEVFSPGHQSLDEKKCTLIFLFNVHLFYFFSDKGSICPLVRNSEGRDKKRVLLYLGKNYFIICLPCSRYSNVIFKKDRKYVMKF